MASFEETRRRILLAYDDEIIDDDEFLLLWDRFTSKNPCFPYWDYENFQLDELDPAECKAEFRFEKSDLHDVAEALQIPETFRCQQRSICDGMEGLCMVLKRFAYPCRYSDMISRFAKPVPVLSMITNTVVDYIYDTHSHWLTQFSCSQSKRLGLFHRLGFDLIALLHAALLLAIVCQDFRFICLCFMFRFATSLNLSLGLP